MNYGRMSSLESNQASDLYYITDIIRFKSNVLNPLNWPQGGEFYFYPLSLTFLPQT